MNGTATPLRTDTVRIPIVVVDDPDTTVEFRPPWLLPPVTATYGRPRRRLRDTAAVAHLTASARSAFYPLAAGSGLIVATVAITSGVL